MRHLILLILLAPLITAQSKGYRTVTVEKAAKLEVLVRWKGELPPSPPLALPADWAARHPADARYCRGCQEKGELKRETLLVDSERRGVANVAVSLPGIKAGKAPLPAASLDNKCGRFAPRVQFVPVGKSLSVKNSDPFAHNARVMRKTDRKAVWNGILGPGQSTKTPRFLVPGLYEIHCDVHPWMKAWLIGTRNPYCGVTDAAGKAVLDGIPPGADEIRVILWHETLGVAVRNLRFEAGKVRSLVLDQGAFKRR